MTDIPHMVGALRLKIQTGEWPAGTKLPPSRSMAKSLGVARATYRKVIVQLEAEGFVESRPRSGVFVASSQSVASHIRADLGESRPTRPAQIAYALAQDISKGNFRTGDFLPLRKQLRFRYRTSPLGLMKAVEMVKEWGLVHARGSALVAGPDLGSEAMAPGQILVYANQRSIMSERRSWGRFLLSLERNASPLGMQIKPRYFWDFGVDKRSFLGKIPAQARAIVCLVRKLPEVAAPRYQPFRNEIRRALGTELPVVIFGLDPFPNVSCESLFGPCPNLFLFQTDDHAVGEDAASFCISRGHRGMAFFSFSTEIWNRERLRGLAKRVRSAIGSDGQVIELAANFNKAEARMLQEGRKMAAATIFREPVKRMLNGFEFSHPAYYARIQPLVRELATTDMHWPHMERLFEKALADRSLTAWICADATIATVAADLLTKKKMSRSTRIHLMGMDDMAELSHLGITALSLNWERMGYLAAHAILGDIPIRRKRNRVVICPHAVIDRGSVGRVTN